MLLIMIRQSTQIWRLPWTPPVLKFDSWLGWDSSHFATHYEIGQLATATLALPISKVERVISIRWFVSPPQDGMSHQKVLLSSKEGIRNLQRKLI